LTAREGILGSAFSRHGKKYFVSHMGEDFITFIVMTHGQYCAKTKAETYNIGEGMCFVLPAKIPCDYFTRFEGFKLIWFHIKNTPQWRRVFGNSIRCQKMMFYEQFVFLYNLYAKELYSRTCSLSYLRNVLQLVIETIRREIFGDEKPADACSEKLHNLIVSMNADLSRPWDAKTAADKMKVDVQKLNSQFRLIFGKTFAKFLLGLRMERALKMLKSGQPLKEIAPAVGFATPYSLSNTFKDFYGASPRAYLKNG